MIPLTPKQVAELEVLARANSGGVTVHIHVTNGEITPKGLEEFVRTHKRAITQALRRRGVIQ
jgi:uncharacterized protein (DUF849 family)